MLPIGNWALSRLYSCLLQSCIQCGAILEVERNGRPDIESLTGPVLRAKASPATDSLGCISLTADKLGDSIWLATLRADFKRPPYETLHSMLVDFGTRPRIARDIM